MHLAEAAKAEVVTDSMKMFNWGVKGGRPAAGEIGIAPEWFYKGTGTVLRGPFEPLVVPRTRRTAERRRRSPVSTSLARTARPTASG